MNDAASQAAVVRHYAHGSLLAAIGNGIARMGKSPDSLDIDDLAALDEFHIGGRQATEWLIEQLRFASGDHVLDIGCGLGGAARRVALRHGARVIGIDLTFEYVHAGMALCRMTRVEGRVSLHQASALHLPFADATFSGAFMLHVGMNIPAKDRLFAEAARVLRPGSLFAVYDVMRTGDGELAFPVPWASDPACSALASPHQYRRALDAAGFQVLSEKNRRDVALDHFRKQRASAAHEPPPLGLHTLMGDRRPDQVRNMAANIAAGTIAPVEIIARRA